MRKTSIRKLFGVAFVLALLVLVCALTAAAEDLTWNLLTDEDAGYVAQNAGGNFTVATEEDGTVYVHNLDTGRAGVYYVYDASGKLLGSKSYHVEHPEEAIPADGTVLTALDGSQTFTVGTAANADGSYTVTELTTFKGTYVALARAMRNISDHLMGLVNYFDAQ